MKTIKQLVYTLAMSVFAVVAFSSCDKSIDILQQGESNTEENKASYSLEEYNEYAQSRFVLASFPSEKVFLDVPCNFGKSKENALVPLVFDQFGFLFTPHQYNALQGSLKGCSLRWTDLETFSQVTGFPYASSKYVKEAIDSLFIFDPYQSQYEIGLQRMQNSPNLRATSSVSWRSLKIGDMLFTSDSKTAYIPHGHIAGIVEEVRSSPSHYRQIRLVEAISPKVVEASMGNWWMTRSSVQRLTLNRSILPSQRQDLVHFLRSKVGEPYYSKLEFVADQTNFEGVYKYDTGKWYCSKLVWAAYYSVFGIDLDSDGGYIVYPRDILNSVHIFSETVTF